MNKIFLFLLTTISCYDLSYAQNEIDLAIFVNAGDNQALISAIENANNGTGPDLIFIRPGPNNETTFTFTQAYMDSDNALPVITANIGFFPTATFGTIITFKRDVNAPSPSKS